MSHKVLQKLAKEMGDAGYCNYAACREYLQKAFDAGRSETICANCGHVESEHCITTTFDTDGYQTSGRMCLHIPCTCDDFAASVTVGERESGKGVREDG